MKIIYGIWHKSEGKYAFIGSTTQTKSQRMTYHRSKARNYPKHPLHQLMAANVNDFEIHQLDKTEDVDLMKAHYIQKHSPTSQELIKIPVSYICDCGKEVASKAALTKHMLTDKHKRDMTLIYPNGAELVAIK